MKRFINLLGHVLNYIATIMVLSIFILIVIVSCWFSIASGEYGLMIFILSGAVTFISSLYIQIKFTVKKGQISNLVQRDIITMSVVISAIVAWFALWVYDKIAG